MGRSIDALLTVNPARLSQAARLAHLDRLRVAAARLAAQTERTIAAASDVSDEKSIDREEIACLLRWSFGYTQARIVEAHKLVNDLPATLDALSRGLLNPEHARAAAEATYGLDARLCGKVENRVLERAGCQTVTEFKRSLTRAVHRVDPTSAEQKHEQAKAERGIWCRPLPDGMAGIYSVHDAVTAEAIYTRIAGLAGKAPPLPARKTTLRGCAPCRHAGRSGARLHQQRRATSPAWPQTDRAPARPPRHRVRRLGPAR